MIVLAWSLLAVALGTLITVVIPYAVQHVASRRHAYSFIMHDGMGWYRVEPVHMDREIATAHLCGYLPYMREVSVYRDGRHVQTVENSARAQLAYAHDAPMVADEETELPADLDILIVEGAYRGRRGKVVDRAGNAENYLLRVEVDLTHTCVEVVARTDFITREDGFYA